ncbi:CaaX prenyl protease-like protein [Dothidotthia symphoricarpi CBS 119687]|uniref:CAAX prenyl protease n=1 Tax=Dothidotthia symphoricarpi CBS 119687 TaxID=1392245 RepID=A0A6A6AUP3_9PLEO|nr:CaaX prenyl protease-like protein [Dothidotthia symphoricarpi CBS 119687]KAF2134261.1 CaaX prenyl protease-like protein [Dothidotthia symphoricarpi CBS 119687]
MIQALLQRLARWLDRPLFPWKKLVVGFSLAEFALENWLLFRQYRVLQRTTVPKALNKEIDSTTFDKSQAYGRAKAKFGFISGVFNRVKHLATLYFNVYPIVWGVAGSLVASYAPVRFSGEITQSLLFMYLLGWIDLAFGLPFSYYHSFVLEEKFGFNKMTVKLWLSDMVKGQALALAFGIPIGSGFLAIIKRTGQNFFYYLWVFMLVVQISAMTIYPILIVPMFNKLEPLKPGKLKESVEALASKLQFPLAELQVIDGSKRSAHSNAYFTGLPWIGKKKIVIYDTLLEKSTEKEVEAVLAHELGHWKMNHTSRLLFISQAHLFYIFALFSVFIKNRSLYADFGFIRQRPDIVGFVLFNEILSPTDSIIKLLMNVWTRKMEYEADAFAVDLGYTRELGASLIKLQIQNLSSMDADWFYSSFHHSHPILTERLKAMSWTGDKKIVEEKAADEDKPIKAGDREL